MAEQAVQPIILSLFGLTVALDERDGTERWRTETTLSWTLVAGNRLFGLTSEKYLCSLRLGDGAQSWIFEEPLHTRDFFDEPPVLATPEAIFCVTASHDIVALRPADGGVLWRHAEPGWVWEGLLGAGGGFLFVQGCEGGDAVRSEEPVDHLTCTLAVDAGAIGWRHAWRGVPSGFEPLVPAVLDETALYCRRDEDEVVSLARADGAVRWRLPLTSSVDCLTLIAPGILGVATNAQVIAVSTEDGTVRWRYRDSRDGVDIRFQSSRRAILPVTDLVQQDEWLVMAIDYISADSGNADPNRAGVLLALAPNDGTLLWRINTEQGARPLLNPGSAVIGFVPTDSYHAYIGALAANDGHELWRQPTTILIDESRGWRKGQVLYAFVGTALTAFAVDDGMVQWTYSLTALGPEVATFTPYAHPRLVF